MSRLQQKFKRYTKSKMLSTAMITLLCLIFGIASSWPAVSKAFQPNLSELPLTFPVQSPEIAEYFNQIARPQDIASFPPSAIPLLSQVTQGQKMVGFFSWSDAERELEALAGQIDMVMYNPEHWEYTPDEEQQDLPATVKRAAEFTHAHGLQFMFAPDRRFAEAHLGEVAPYADAVLLQVQRVQQDPQTLVPWVNEMASTARAGNPEIQVYVQVGATRGTASEMFAAIQSVSDDIDGIAVWSLPRTKDVLEEFVTLIRESPPAVEATTASHTPTIIQPTPTTAMTEEVTPTLIPSPSETATSTSARTATETPTTASVTPTPDVSTMTSTSTPLPSLTSVATSTPTPRTLETPPTPSVAATTAAPSATQEATSTLTPTTSNVATPAVAKIAIDTSSPTNVPAPPNLPPQVKQKRQARSWLESIGLVVVGILIGVLLGSRLNWRRHKGQDLEER
jgi:hypothetical protein